MTKVVEHAPCPSCRKNLSGATPFTDPGVTPQTDDISVCMHCGAILIYNGDLTQRLASGDDRANWDDETVAQLTILSSLVQNRLGRGIQ